MFPVTEIEFGKLSDLPHDGYVFVEAKQVSRWSGMVSKTSKGGNKWVSRSQDFQVTTKYVSNRA